jgi:hypothetical protein
MADEGMVGGRWTKPTEATVISSKAGAVYPRLPASSPWADWPSPPEEPLGYAIDAVEPVGSPGEVAESIERLKDDPPA